jgi:Xaa-Pro aminopeptidase
VSFEKMSGAIFRENLGGWLFSSFHGRDSLSLSILESICATEGGGRLTGGRLRLAKNTRPWYYVVFADGSALKIVHGIEADILGAVPGGRLEYYSRENLSAVLRDKVLPRLEGRELACQFSVELPVLSFLDHGTAVFLEGLGFRLVSSAALVQRFFGLLDSAGFESHARAARDLYAIIRTVWARLEDAMNRGEVFEGTVLSWITGELEAASLNCSPGLIVAAGVNSGNPHYGIEGRGCPIGSQEIVQFDIWAKKKSPGAVYADISWVGFTGRRPLPRMEKDFAALARARDAAVSFIASALEAGQTGEAGRPPRGMDVDAHVRALLAGAGYAGALRHRTGHGIDTEVHGCGVNLDSVEFPDSRFLLEGSCFSVEPGIYFDDYGLRSEINVIIKDGRPLVSGDTPQRELLVFH